MDKQNDKYLETLWNEMLHEQDTDYESPRERKRRLEKLHNSLGWKKKGLYLPTWAVAASILLLAGGFSAVLLTRREGPAPHKRMCLLAR